MTDTTDDRTRPDSDTTRRVTVAEAAEILGITHDAVRARIRRGSLQAVRVNRSWLVHVPAAESDHTTRDTTTTERDTTRPDSDQVERIADLKSEIAYLRGQLDQVNRERAAERERFDVIHREALNRLEALTAGIAPTDAPEAPGAPIAPEPTPDTPAKSWWRRWFGL